MCVVYVQGRACAVHVCALQCVCIRACFVAECAMQCMVQCARYSVICCTMQSRAHSRCSICVHMHALTRQGVHTACACVCKAERAAL